MSIPSKKYLLRLIDKAAEQPLAMSHYPSRGQSAIQKVYITKIGKIFFKKTSERNTRDCQINKNSASLAEREFWAWRLGNHLNLKMPWLVLLDDNTTAQNWLDYPDASLFKSLRGRLVLNAQNTFDHALLDWITGQQDRHDANYLYNPSENKIILIDNAFSFLKHDGSMPDYLSYFEASSPNELSTPINKNLLNRILKIPQTKLKRLIPLRDPEEFKALLIRRRRLKTVQCLQDLLNLYRRKS